MICAIRERRAIGAPNHITRGVFSFGNAVDRCVGGNMRKKALFVAGAVTLAMVLGMGSANVAGAAARAPGAPGVPAHPARPGSGLPRTVTLVTGDRLTVSPGSPDHVTVKGRPGITFLTRTWHGHLQVVPSDALALLHKGRL